MDRKYRNEYDVVIVPQRGKITADFLKYAIARFYRHHHRLPSEIVVHSSVTDAVKRMVHGDLSVSIPVVSSGGVASCEVFLCVTRQDGRK